MLIGYMYKLDPSRNQTATMEKHIEMLRLQYNFRIRERTEAYSQVSHPVMGNYCDLVTKAECCPLTCFVSNRAMQGEPWTIDKKTGRAKLRSAKAQQDADLPNLKLSRPWYKQIQHHVLQQMLRRVDDGFQRFFSGEAKYPKTKRRGKFRSFSYPPGDVRFNGNRVRLPGIGWMRFFQSRPFSDGIKVRSVTVRRKADGWYVSVRLQDDSVPSSPSPNEVKTAIGVDLGIAKLASLSTGETIPNPRFGQKLERRRKILHRRASRKVKGSTKRRQAYQRLARLENTVANQRLDHQWKLAKKLTAMADLVVFEDLNIKGMCARCKPKKDELSGRYLENGQAAKSGLNKAILDASWGELKQKVKVMSEKAGVIFLEINPRHSSQECSECGYISPTNRDKERFLCEACSYLADADVDAAIVIRKRGLEELGINLPKLPGVPRKVTPKERPVMVGISAALVAEPGKPPAFVQLSLFEMLESREGA